MKIFEGIQRARLRAAKRKRESEDEWVSILPDHGQELGIERTGYKLPDEDHVHEHTTSKWPRRHSDRILRNRHTKDNLNVEEDFSRGVAAKNQADEAHLKTDCGRQLVSPKASDENKGSASKRDEQQVRPFKCILWPPIDSLHP